MQILKTTTPPESDIQNSSGMCILVMRHFVGVACVGVAWCVFFDHFLSPDLQVRTVFPVAKQHDKFRGKNVPDKVAA